MFLLLQLFLYTNTNTLLQVENWYKIPEYYIIDIIRIIVFQPAFVQ